jgi:hypothetical protein
LDALGNRRFLDLTRQRKDMGLPPAVEMVEESGFIV